MRFGTILSTRNQECLYGHMIYVALSDVVKEEWFIRTITCAPLLEQTIGWPNVWTSPLYSDGVKTVLVKGTKTRLLRSSENQDKYWIIFCIHLVSEVEKCIWTPAEDGKNTMKYKSNIARHFSSLLSTSGLKIATHDISAKHDVGVVHRKARWLLFWSVITVALNGEHAAVISHPSADLGNIQQNRIVFHEQFTFSTH